MIIELTEEEARAVAVALYDRYTDILSHSFHAVKKLEGRGDMEQADVVRRRCADYADKIKALASRFPGEGPATF